MAASPSPAHPSLGGMCPRAALWLHHHPPRPWSLWNRPRTVLCDRCSPPPFQRRGHTQGSHRQCPANGRLFGGNLRSVLPGSGRPPQNRPPEGRSVSAPGLRNRIPLSYHEARLLWNRRSLVPRGPFQSTARTTHATTVTVPANYRMKLTRLGHRFAQGTDNQPSTHSLARARLGLQLMRGR